MKTYKELIELGFKRIDMDDNVCIEKTGYGGFVLERKVSGVFKAVIDNEDFETAILQFHKCDNSGDVIRVETTTEKVIEMIKSVDARKKKKYTPFLA